MIKFSNILKHFQNLKEFHFESMNIIMIGNEIGDEGLIYFCKKLHYAPNIEIFDCCCIYYYLVNDITDKGIDELTKNLKYLKKCEDIYLNSIINTLDNKITYSGIKNFIDNITKLEFLNIKGIYY